MVCVLFSYCINDIVSSISQGTLRGLIHASPSLTFLSNACRGLA